MRHSHARGFGLAGTQDSLRRTRFFDGFGKSKAKRPSEKCARGFQLE
ncbi:hypothetical protein HMPREF9123_2196 [Neisseria bacilliformis ATCC BAA-1200]|uniref:Uncharacterized protein n=1 Tax=Neisseria bacilliformis ATCC BAA-1200 TaxID=888742 RepID=F2BEN9_9NEIS|nr:hypothetical protein HMPREF9123_2196 [Neisseria bacilliformis ATCC BAA-1200]